MVAKGWPIALLFDVMELNNNEEGRTISNREFCPVLLDEKALEV